MWEGNIYTNLEVIDMIHKIICETSKSEKTINFIKDRLGHDKRYSLNNSKIISELGWKISKDKFIQNLKTYIDKEFIEKKNNV